jgi:hypothetical protein
MTSRFIRSLGLILGIGLLISGCGTQPSATPAETASPQVVWPTAETPPTPAIGSPKALRDDISIRRVARAGGGYVRMALDTTTNTIYIMNSGGTIQKLMINADGSALLAPAHNPIEIGLRSKFGAAGLAFGPDGTMYVLENVDTPSTNQIVVHRGKVQGDKREWAVLAETEPYPRSDTQFDHNGNGLIVSLDGESLFLNIGSRSDHGEIQDTKGANPNTREVPLSSAIFRVSTSTDGQVLPNDEAELKSKGYLYADGVRNAYDLAFNADGDLFAIDNGPDSDFADELNWIREGHHYGFPWRFGNVDNPVRFEGYDPAKDGRLQQGFYAVSSGFYKYDAEYPAPPEGITFSDPVVNIGPDADIFREADGKIYDGSIVGQPTYTFSPHRSQLGLVFDTNNELGADLTGLGFMVSWGAAAGDLPDTGRDLLSIKATKIGDNYQIETKQIAVGFNFSVDAVLLGKKLYVLDWGGDGFIWEVSMP